MSVESTAAAFERLGARFASRAAEIAVKLEKLQGLVFDWDGVFNDGTKGGGVSSGFSEADSMGANMLRYGLWLQRRRLPVCCLISGENNHAAAQFARREHFDGAYGGIRDKRLAVRHLCERHGVSAEHLACLIDDINDLPMARLCGLRFFVKRSASPLLTAYAIDAGLCDYVTGNSGGRHAVREISELMLSLLGVYPRVVESRTAVDAQYLDYFTQRQSVATRFYRQKGAEITAADDDAI
jgi:3-deoxy-D-manno-octulosonate 8-phosphate phosphatase (KDO 8-P phosphatase)